MEKRFNKEELMELIESLGIDYEDFWVLSTGSMVLRDIWPDAGDLDIAVTKKGFEDLSKKYNLIDKHNNFFIVKDNVECVIDEKNDDNVEKFGKYNLQRLERYLEYIKKANRPKDAKKIPALEKAIEERNKQKCNDDDER